MNFLAHFFLSDEDDLMLSGAMMGDFIKGPVPDHLPERLAGAVRLHRRIDRFADTHPLFKASSGFFRERWGLYGAVLIDIFYDHLLAGAWHRYSNESLPGFAARVYAACRRTNALMPERMVPAVESMIRYDWLNSYRFEQGVSQVLQRISTRMEQRTGENPRLEAAWPGFAANRSAISGHFEQFFVEMQQFVVDEKGTLSLH